jgi:phosphopantetheine--protein transferase-like protein
MAGEDMVAELCAYLSRLTGQTLTAESTVRLRSVERAALAAWARRKNLPLRMNLIAGALPFGVRDLMEEEENEDSSKGSLAALAAADVAPLAASTAQAFAAIGVDIEEVESLPVAADYREHAFYRDNFTPSEIAHCVRQVDVRASFCGTWAAKEAVLKAGLAAAPAGHLKQIEIAHDSAGRPAFPGCQLSISHTPRTAVAVCLATAPSAPAGPVEIPTEPAAPPLVAPAAAGRRMRWPWSRQTAQQALTS